MFNVCFFNCNIYNINMDPLHTAIANHNLHNFKKLIDDKYDLHTKYNGQNIMHTIGKYRFINFITFFGNALLELNYEVDDNGLLPIQYAIINNDFEMFSHMYA